MTSVGYKKIQRALNRVLLREIDPVTEGVLKEHAASPRGSLLRPLDG